MKKKIFQSILNLFCLMSISGFSQITSHIPPTNLNLPVLIIIPASNGEFSGSGFMLEDKNTFWYFVTAKHVIFSYDTIQKKDKLIGNKATLRILDADVQDTSVHILSLDLEFIQKDNRILTHRSADIVLIKIGDSDSTHVRTFPGAQWTAKGKTAIHTRQTEMLLSYNDVKVGNDVFVYGYPNSIGLKWMPQFDYNRPLLRKGIVAGKYEKTHTIILDCPIYFGNSGGPVIQESFEETGPKFKIIGIVTQLIPFDESKLNKALIPTMLFTNSGYAVAESADRIFEILKASK